MNNQTHVPKYTRQGTPDEYAAVASYYNRFARNEDPLDGFELDVVDDQTIRITYRDEAAKVAHFYVASLFEPYFCGMTGQALKDLAADVDSLAESTQEIKESARLVEKQASTLKRRQAHLALVARHLRLMDGLKDLVAAAHIPRCITTDDIGDLYVSARRIVDQAPA